MNIDLDSVTFDAKKMTLWQRIRGAFFFIKGAFRVTNVTVDISDIDLVAVKPEFVRRYEKMQAALQTIQRWDRDTFPACDNGYSYSYNYGSHGERDFMRGVAAEALKP